MGVRTFQREVLTATAIANEPPFRTVPLVGVIVAVNTPGQPSLAMRPSPARHEE